MAKGQSFKNPAWQSGVYMLGRLNFVWWRVRKAIGMFWRVNFVRLELGKAEKPRMSVYFYIHVLTRRLRLMATEKAEKPRMSVWCLHAVTRKLRVMATGQSRKTQDVSLLLHVLMRRIRLMATGQSRKNPGWQSSVYMLWHVNFVWWWLGKA